MNGLHNHSISIQQKMYLYAKLNWLTKNHKLVNMNILDYSKMVGSKVVNITKENIHAHTHWKYPK